MAASLTQTLRRMRRTLRQEFVGQVHVSTHLFQRQLVRRASGLGVVEVKPQPGDEIEGLCKLGQLDKAVQVLLRMNEQGSIPSVQIYRRILKACSVTKALAQVKRVQGHLTRHALGSNRFLGEYLVTVLVKCGGLGDALQVFYTLPHRTVVSWTAVISGYSMSRNCHECLRMYRSMLAEGVWPDSYTLVSLLKACGNLKNLEEGKRIHAEAVKYNCEADLFVRTCLVDMYRKCGSMTDAQTVFDGLSTRDVVSWTVMLAAYVEQGQAAKALELYVNMREEGVSPNDRTFMSVLQACGIIATVEGDVTLDGRSVKVEAITKGKAIHAHAQMKGYASNAFVCTTLVGMYGKCGSVEDAKYVFDESCQQDVATWNVMLVLYVQQCAAEKASQLYERMQEAGVSPDARTFVSVLQACTMLAQKEDDVVVNGHCMKVAGLARCKSVHAKTRIKGCDLDIFVANTLLSTYGKCGDVEAAQDLFDKMACQDLVSWTSLLTAYATQGQADKALRLYQQQLNESVSPDILTLAVAVQVCAMLAEEEDYADLDGNLFKVKSLEMGMAMHAAARRRGFCLDAFLCSIAINMYSKCGSIVDAQNVFDALSERDVVAWTAILAAYVEQGQAETVLNLSEQMQDEGISPNDRTCVVMLQACGILAEKENDLDLRFFKVKALEKGRAIHDYARRKGYGTDTFVGITLVSMYGKCGSIVDARDVFDSVSKRNVVAWNAMLAAYVGQGQEEEAVELYEQMLQGGATPDDVTHTCLLQACGNTGRLETVQEIHRTLISTSHEEDLSSFLASTLINAYGRCARIEDAKAVFDAIPCPDVVSWNAVVSVYARQGNHGASLYYYSEMLTAGIKPDRVTFLSLLCACSHAGLVEEGLDYFESMSRDHGISPQIEHYASIIDLLGRAGCFGEVEAMLSVIPMQPDLAMLLCLLGACRKHRKVALGEQMFHWAVRLHPTHAAAYVMMSNIYADAGYLEHAETLKLVGEQAGALAKPGCSWIEHGKGIGTFVARDSKHGQEELLCQFARQLGADVQVIIQRAVTTTPECGG